jgi:hypothetical protein
MFSAGNQGEHDTERDCSMTENVECMCQQCGISLYLPADAISLEDPGNIEVKTLSDLHICEKCGGKLVLIGKAGDEPHYRLK